MIRLILFVIAFANNFNNQALNIATLVFVVVGFLTDIAYVIASRN